MRLSIHDCEKGDPVVNLIYMEDGDEFMVCEPIGKKYVAAGGGCIPRDSDINGDMLEAAIDTIIRSITGLKKWKVDVICTNDV